MTVEPGWYQHYKGGQYRVIGVGEHSETGEKLVVYTDLNGRIWIRPEAMFDEEVELGDRKVPRFRKVA